MTETPTTSLTDWESRKGGSQEDEVQMRNQEDEFQMTNQSVGVSQWFSSISISERPGSSAGIRDKAYP